MTQQYHEILEKADISISSSGDNTLIAAPGDGKYVAIDFIQFMPNSAVTIQMKVGASNYGGAYSFAGQQANTIENTLQNEHGIITVPNNTAFVMNLSAPVQVSGFIRYRIINK